METKSSKRVNALLGKHGTSSASRKGKAILVLKKPKTPIEPFLQSFLGWLHPREIVYAWKFLDPNTNFEMIGYSRNLQKLRLPFGKPSRGLKASFSRALATSSGMELLLMFGKTLGYLGSKASSPIQSQPIPILIH